MRSIQYRISFLIFVFRLKVALKYHFLLEEIFYPINLFCPLKILNPRLCLNLLCGNIYRRNFAFVLLRDFRMFRAFI